MPVDTAVTASNHVSRYEIDYRIMSLREGGFRSDRESAKVFVLPLSFVPEIEWVGACGEPGISGGFGAMDARGRADRTVCGYGGEPGIPALFLQELRCAGTEAEPEWEVLGGPERIVGCGSRNETAGQYFLGGACAVVHIGRGNRQV